MNQLPTILIFDLIRLLVVCPGVAWISVICLYKIPQHYKEKRKLKCWIYLWILLAGLGTLVNTFSYQ